VRCKLASPPGITLRQRQLRRERARLAVVDLTLLKKSNVACRDDAAIFRLVDPNHRLRQWSDYGWPGAKLSRVRSPGWQ
jgi:hypothetical protein